MMKRLDADLEKETLMDAWKNRDEEIARILRDGADASDQRLKDKLNQRQEDRKRKKVESLKLKHEEEEARVELDGIDIENVKFQGELN